MLSQQTHFKYTATVRSKAQGWRMNIVSTGIKRQLQWLRTGGQTQNKENRQGQRGALPGTRQQTQGWRKTASGWQWAVGSGYTRIP